MVKGHYKAMNVSVVKLWRSRYISDCNGLRMAITFTKSGSEVRLGLQATSMSLAMMLVICLAPNSFLTAALDKR
jgi:hypothetical protein